MTNTLSRLEKIKYKKWQLNKIIVEVIIGTLISGGGHPLRPILPLAIKTILEILKEKNKINVEESKIKRVLNNLEKNEILSIKEENEQIFVYQLNNNNPKLIKYSIKALLDFKQTKHEWIGKWYLVFFDVPEIQRNKRNYLRMFLLKIGFFPYQKSVYIFPYECEEEIKLIKKIVEGAKYMKYIIADKIENEEEVKRFFKLI